MPMTPEWQAQMVRELIRQNRWDEAERQLTEALARTPDHPELLACQTWIWLYRTRELDAYPVVRQLLSEGYQDPEWLEDVVLPLRNYFICVANDPTLTIKTKRKQDGRQTLRACAQELEQWLQRYQIPIPEEPVGTRITLCMIAKDEAEYLEECLKSVQGAVDEIVLVDTGSTDDTVQIAERYGAKVIYAEWRHDFAYARNIALQHATGDWILILDADERLQGSKTRQAIREGARHPQFGGYYIEIANILDFASPQDVFLHRAVRMFRRFPHARWEGAIHEQIILGAEERTIRYATLQNAQILHLGYERSIIQSKNKEQRNIAILERVLAETPDDWFQLFNLANTYCGMGDYERAEPLLERVCQNADLRLDFMPHAWSLWIECLIARGELERATEMGRLGVEKLPNSPQIHYALARAYHQAGNLQSAYEHLLKVRETAIQIGLLSSDGATLEVGSGYTGDPTVATYKWHHLMAQTLMAWGRLDEAEAHIEYFEQMRPHDPVGMLTRAEWYRLKGEFETASALYTQLAELPPYRLTALQLQAQMWWNTGNYGRAIPAIRQLASLQPENEALWHQWMFAAEQVGNPDWIIEAFEWRANQALPLTAEMHINWGRALWQTGQYQQALSHFTEAIRLDPLNTNALLNAGDALYQLGAYYEASEAYTTALKQDPQNAQAWFTLGNCYARLRIYEAARLAYQQALRINPLHAEAQQNLELINDIIRTTAA